MLTLILQFKKSKYDILSYEFLKIIVIIIIVVSDFSSVNESRGDFLSQSEKSRTPDSTEPSESHRLMRAPFRIRTGKDYRR